MSKRILAFFLALASVLCPLAAFGVESLEIPRPVLKQIVPYTLADMNNDIAGKMMEEITEYQVVFDVLPQDDPTTKLLFEVATGAEYDIIKCVTEQFIALKSQGALVDLAPYVEAYGPYLRLNASALSDQLVTGENGELYGLPLINNPTMDAPYGMLRHGFAFRGDVLAELNLPLPRTLPELKDCLTTLYKHTGISPLTIASGSATAWVLPVLSAYGMGEAEWYLQDDVFVPRVRMPGMADYIAYMQMLYREKLLDPEFPINKTENTIEKMAGGRAFVTTMYFWDIPTLKDAFEAGGLPCEIDMVGTLQSDALTPAVYFVDYGIYNIFCIPRSSRHVADAVNYMNLQSAPETFLSIYLGKEGEHYEVVDGKYYPLLPGFEPFLNAAQYTSLSPGNEFVYWQARARKTPEMAKAHEQMNSEIPRLTLYPDKSSFAYGQKGTEVRASLNKLLAEKLIAAIVMDTPPEEALREMIAAWESGGGLTFESAMNTWYQENKDDAAFLEP